MAKYKITFFNDKYFRKMTRDVKTKAEVASIAQNFDKNKVDYEAQEYNKREGRYGWRVFQPSNYCQICGRALSNPKSVNRGIGPECAKKYRVPKDSNVPEDVCTKTLDNLTTQNIIKMIPEYYRDECKFCNGMLNHIVYYYEHDGGWYVESLDKRVWLWLECSKCGHQWSLDHLRVSRTCRF